MLLTNITVQAPMTRNSERVRKAIVGIAYNQSNKEIKRVCEYSSDGTIGDLRRKMRKAIEDNALKAFLQKYDFEVSTNEQQQIEVNFPADIKALYNITE
jgi:hypothetical protein